MPFDFNNKRVLVTGAGRGIGRELSKAIAAAGGDVYALSITKENLDSLVEEVPSIHAVRVDLSDWEATRRELDKLERFDGVVNNAGINFPFTDATNVTKENIETAFNVNVMAAINVIQTVGKKMIESKRGGSIVNISTFISERAYKGLLPYTVSKAALNMVTKQFALELGPHKIRVNTVNPSMVYTDMAQEYLKNDPGMEKSLISDIPMGKIVNIQEVLDPILYLLSDHSSMVSGTTNYVDGGQTCHITF